MAEENKAKPAEVPAKGGRGGIVPLLLVVVLVPAISYAMTEFLIIPKIKATLAAADHEAKPEKPHGLPKTQKESASHSLCRATVRPTMITSSTSMISRSERGTARMLPKR